MRLENKIALVTAAASGMGRAGVIRFAAEGAQVAAVDIDQAALDAVVKEITDAGGDAVAIKADLTKDNECHRIVDDTIDAFGVSTTPGQTLFTRMLSAASLPASEAIMPFTPHLAAE